MFSIELNSGAYGGSGIKTMLLGKLSSPPV